MSVGNINQGLMQGFSDRSLANQMQIGAVASIQDHYGFLNKMMKELGVETKTVKNHMKKLNLKENNLYKPFAQTNFSLNMATARYSVDSKEVVRTTFTDVNSAMHNVLSSAIFLHLNPLLGDKYEITANVDNDTSYKWFLTFIEKDIAISFNSRELSEVMRKHSFPDLFGSVLYTVLGQVPEFHLEQVMFDSLQMLLNLPIGELMQVSRDANGNINIVDTLFDKINVGVAGFEAKQYKTIKDDFSAWGATGRALDAQTGIKFDSFTTMIDSPETYQDIRVKYERNMRAIAERANSKYESMHDRSNPNASFEIQNIAKYAHLFTIYYILHNLIHIQYHFSVANFTQSLNMIMYGTNVNLMAGENINLPSEFDTSDVKRRDGSIKLADIAYKMTYDNGYNGGHIDYVDNNNGTVLKMDSVIYPDGSSVSNGIDAGGVLKTANMESIYKYIQKRHKDLIQKNAFNYGKIPGLSPEYPIHLFASCQSLIPPLLADIKEKNARFNMPNYLYNNLGVDGAYLKALNFFNSLFSNAITLNSVVAGTTLDPVFPITMNKVVNGNGVSVGQDTVTYWIRLSFVSDNIFGSITNPLFAKDVNVKQVLCKERDSNNKSRSTSMYQHKTKYDVGLNKFRSAVDNIDGNYSSIKTHVNNLLDNYVGGRPNVAHFTDVTFMANNHKMYQDESGCTIACFQQILDIFNSKGRIRPTHDMTVDLMIANNDQLVKELVNPTETRIEFIVPSFNAVQGGFTPVTMSIPL